MLEHLMLDKILFLDIETVSEHKDYDELSSDFQDLWKIKAHRFIRAQAVEWTEGLAKSVYQEKAGIFAEFGKIIVISVGYLVHRDLGGLQFRVKSYAGDSEREVLQKFSDLLNHHFNLPELHSLCGHNIKEFDIPYICRRMLINGLPLPPMIDVTGKKPWETKHLVDTFELWKFGDYKNYTSLKLLAGVMGVPSPKDDIDGSDVGRVYWEDRDVDRIARYCEKDVITVAQLLLKLKGKALLGGKDIFISGRSESEEE